MKRNALTFTKIDIRKMPGLEDGLGVFDNLSPGINIIAGPNASGKSSMARAIQQLIWQNQPARITADGQFLVDKDSWKTSVDHLYCVMQRQGSDTALKGLPEPESQSRYLLSLHELIQTDEEDLADRIRKDAIGGYDIEQAKKHLGYSLSFPGQRGKSITEYRTADKKVAELTSRQQELKNEQSNLSRYKEQLLEIKEAEKRINLYRLLKRFKEKQGDLRHLEQRLAQYPGIMASVREEDATNLERLDAEIRESQDRIESIQQNIEANRHEIDNQNLPDRGVDAKDLRLLENLLEELREKELEIDRLEETVLREKTVLDETGKRLGLSPEFGTTEDKNLPDSFDGLDLAGIDTTDQFWQQTFDLYGQMRWHEKVIEDLRYEGKHLGLEATVETKDEAKDPNRLRNGIEILSRWLQTYGRASSSTAISHGIFFVALAAGVAAAVYFWGAWGFTGLIPLVLLLLVWQRSQRKSREEVWLLRQKDFEDSGLRGPERWDAEGVTRRLKELLADLELSVRQERRKELLSEYERKLKTDQLSWNRIEEEASEWRRKLGALPDIRKDSLERYSSLYWYLTHLLKWQSSRDNIRSSGEGIGRNRKIRDEILNRVHPILEKYHLEPEERPAELKATVSTLIEKKDSWNQLRNEIASGEKEIVLLTRARDKAIKDRNDIFERLEVSTQDNYKVKELVDNLADWKDLMDKAGSARQNLLEIRTELEGFLSGTNPVRLPEIITDSTESGVSSIINAIDTMSLEEISDLITEQEQLVAKRDDVQRKVSLIEVRTDQAKQSHDLEEALQQREEKLGALVDHYHQNAASIAGALISEQVIEHIGQTNKPKVLAKAQKLFRQITRNRYEVIIGDDREPRFRAIDHADGLGRSLDELSTGTRIQLILSVRLAYIEQAEQGLMLPILADELLANSDTQRAHAIIDALAEISRQGRQIFYFTAQEDEVAKFRERLAGQKDIGLQCHVIEEKRAIASQTKAPGQTVEPDPDQGIGQNPGTDRDQTEAPGQTPEADRDQTETPGQTLEAGANRAKVPGRERGQNLHDLVIIKPVPRPDGLTYEEYAEKLSVPPANPLRPVGQLHVWYLLNDPHLLFNILEYGIENWDMLKTWLREGGVIDPLNETIKEKLHLNAKLAERYLSLVAHGRNRPVDTTVLDESGAISPNFIGRVADLLKTLRQDPGELIKALENGQIPRFQKTRIKDLQDYLIDQGFFATAQPYTPGEISIKISAYISQLSMDRQEAQILVDRLNRSRIMS